MADLEERISRLEAMEEIRRLKLRYAELCDRGYQADALAELFTEDAVWDAGDRGICHGRESIRRHWMTMGAQIPFAVHYITNHTIDLLDNSHATGTAYLWQPLVMEGRAHWSATAYREHYRMDDRWRFSAMKLKVALLVPYGEAWTADEPFLEA